MRSLTMTRRNSQWELGQEAKSPETPGMVAFGEMPARDREFEALLRRAADIQKTDSGCRLRGEAS
jgi:hypothetical protein